MGEFVNEMQERMLPEYEQMRNYQICTPDQIREIIRKREKLQLTLTQSRSTASNYLDYIIYEKEMHHMITQKETVTGLKLTGLKAAIAARIIRLHRDVLGKFPYDQKLWNSFIRFSKKSVPQEVAGIYEKMLSYHGDKHEVWVSAALWLYEYNRLNIARVRDILLRGLQRHPTSEALHKCLFDVLLEEAVLSDSQRNLSENTVSEQDIAMERVETVYRSSMANVTHVDYFLKLLESCEKHSELTAKLQLQIIDNMQEMFPREPALWNALAQRELRGLNITDLRELEKSAKQRQVEQQAPEEDDDQEAGQNPAKKTRAEPPSVFQQRSQKRRIELCVTVYKTATRTLQTQSMWCLYIDAMLALNKDNSTERQFKHKCLKDALQEGHRSKLMHVEHYATLRDMLVSAPNGVEAAACVLTEALEHEPSLRMHELLLATHILNEDEPKIFALFQQARKTLAPDAALIIWKLAIYYYRLRTNEPASVQRLEQIYQQACEMTCPKFADLRCDYLRYCWENHSPEKAREEYKRLALMPPMSLQLHRHMAKMEENLSEYGLANKKSWRLCYEYMANYFGRTEPRVWLDYIAFERDQDEPKSIARLNQRALATLDSKLVPIFESERALAQVAFSSATSGSAAS